MSASRVAFLGMGLMGLPMALRLLAAGVPLTAWNRSKDKCAPVAAAGATVAATPREAAAGADLVLMCLMDAGAVEQVVFGKDGVATAGKPVVLVDHSSIRPDATSDFAARLQAACGGQWLDAPVSGGVVGAKAGTLAIMAGGDAAAVARAAPVLAHYSGQVTHMGPVGAGQTTKLANQVIVGSTIAVIAEAVRLAKAGGVDPALLTRALAGGWADSKPFQVFVPRMVTAPTDAIGAADTMLKDLDTALDLARQTGTPLAMAELAASLMRALVASRGGDSDLSRLVEG